MLIVLFKYCILLVVFWLFHLTSWWICLFCHSVLSHFYILKSLLLNACKFRIVISFQQIEFFITMKSPFLSVIICFTLNSTMSDKVWPSQISALQTQQPFLVQSDLLSAYTYRNCSLRSQTNLTCK